LKGKPGAAAEDAVSGLRFCDLKRLAVF